MKRVLVTGASGFIGSHVAEELVQRGVPVRVLIRKKSSLRHLSQVKVETATGDVTEPASLPAALEGVEGVIHCAGLTRAISYQQYRSVNRDGTENILRACLAANPHPSRIVCLGSLAAYGPSCASRPLTETDQPHPVSYYGRSKLEGHKVAESFMKNLSITILLPPAVYGPRDKDVFVYFKLADLGIVPFLGFREKTISLIHVQDVAGAAAECLLRKEASGRSYFVEDGQPHSWKDFARAICSARGTRSLPIVLPLPVARFAAVLAEIYARISRRPPLLGIQKMRELAQPSWTCSGERIRKELGFQCRFPLSVGVADTLSWYKEHHWL
jgi:nucleoside-diphosphate-sugar epimerase